MKIQFLKHSKINKEKWNQCIENSSFPTFFAEFDFLSIANPKFCALVLNDYEAVMPLPVRKKLFLPHIYHPHFIITLGIFSKTNPTKELTEHFLQAIPSYYVKIDVFFNTFFDHPKASTKHWHQLSLQKKYSELYANFSDNYKKDVMALEKHALKYVESTPIPRIIALFKNNCGKNADVPYEEKDYEILDRLAHFAQKKHRLEVVSVRDEEDNLLAGALIFKDNHKTWFWFSGHDERFTHKKAVFFLLNEYFKRNSETEIIFDFCSSLYHNVTHSSAEFGAEKYELSLLQKRLF